MPLANCLSVDTPAQNLACYSECKRRTALTNTEYPARLPSPGGSHIPLHLLQKLIMLLLTRQGVTSETRPYPPSGPAVRKVRGQHLSLPTHLKAHTDMGQLLPSLHLLFPGAPGAALSELRGGATAARWPWWLGLSLLASPPSTCLASTPPSFPRKTPLPSPLELLSWQHGVTTLDSPGGQTQKIPLAVDLNPLVRKL